MANTKVSKKETWMEIKDILKENEASSSLIDFCSTRIKANNPQKKANKPSPSHLEMVANAEKVFEILSEAKEPMSIPQIMEDDRVFGISAHKMTAILTYLRGDDKKGYPVRVEGKSIKRIRHYQVKSVEESKEENTELEKVESEVVGA